MLQLMIQHYAIAILRYTIPNADSEKDEVKFLVFKDVSSGKYRFYSRPSSILGMSFSYARFESALKKIKGISVNTKFDFDAEYKANNEDETPISVYYVDIDSFDKDKLENSDSNSPADLDNYELLSFEELEGLESEWEAYQLPVLSNFLLRKGLPSTLTPILNKDFLSTIKYIQDAKQQGKLTVFVGAGVSLNSGLPSWNSLIQELSEDVEVLSNNDDSAEIKAQLFSDAKPQTEYIKKLRKVLRYKKAEPNPIHKALKILQPQHIITTNYDDLIEQEISKRYSVIKEDKDLAYAETSNFLIKMHGDLELKNIVLTEDDYLQYSTNFPLIETFVKSVFSSGIVLFIGFSYNDRNLKQILDSVKEILKKDFQPAYIYLDNNDYLKRKDYLRKRGVIPITYDAKIQQYIPSADNNDMSSLGNELFYFLTFLNEYDRYNVRNKREHIIDQLYNSLFRFNEVNSLPIKFLSKLIPFNQVNEKGYSHGYHLETRNEDVIELFKNIKTTNNKLTVSEEYASGIKDKVWDYENKVEYIIYFLKRSGISCIKRKFDDRQEAHNRIFSINTKSCDCYKCQLKAFKLDNLFKTAVSLTSNFAINKVDERSLHTAHTLYLTGHYLESFFLLERIAEWSFKKDLFITHFIVKYNQKSSFNNLNWDKHIDNNVKDKIKEQVSQIDLDQIIHELPIKDKKIRELLLYINKEKAFNTSKIASQVEEIRVTKKFYKNGGNITHTPTIYLLDQEFNCRYKYNYYNPVFNTHPFNKIVELYFEGVLLSYTVSEKYKGKINEINNLIIIQAITYLEPKLLKKVIADNIDNTVLKIQNTPKLVEIASNFFKSNHSVSNFFIKTVTPNKVFINQIEKNYLKEQEIRYWYQNFLTILSYTDLSEVEKNELDSLVENILNYTKVALPNSWYNLDDLIAFFNAQTELFSSDKIDKLYKLILKSNHSDKVGNLSCIINKKTNSYTINDAEIIGLIKMKATTPDSSPDLNIDCLAEIYGVANESLKEWIKTKLVEEVSLNGGFNFQVFEQGLYKGVFDKSIIKKHMPQYVEKLKVSLKVLSNLEFDEVGGINYRKLNSSPINSIVYSLFKTKYFKQQSFKWVLASDEYSDFVKWSVFPAKFDYENGAFDFRWLLYFKREEYFINILKKIKGFDKVVYQLSINNPENAELAKLYFKYFAKK